MRALLRSQRGWMARSNERRRARGPCLNHWSGRLQPAGGGLKPAATRGRVEIVNRVDVAPDRQLVQPPEICATSLGDVRVARTKRQQQLASGGAESDEIDSAVSRRRDHR